MNKTGKELAHLHDLFVAPDWGERFAELTDEHVKLPKNGRVLYVAAGTGGHALALKERAGKDVSLVCVDESHDRLELARVKAQSLNISATEIDFRVGQLDQLAFIEDQFALVLGDASMVAPERIPEMLAEMVRVAAPGARVALNVTTASSFGEFFSIYWEALINVGLPQEAQAVETLITQLPTVSEVETVAAREALEEVASWTRKEEFDYSSGEEFVRAPLVENFLLEAWLEPLAEDEEMRRRVLDEVARIINDERQGGDFSLSIKATIVVGRKAQ